jgi:hypothetical protein
MKLFKIALLSIFAFANHALLPTVEVSEKDISEKDNQELLRAIFLRWEGQEKRIPQLIKEAGLSEYGKPMRYYNGDDHVATFHPQEKTVETFIEMEDKIVSLGLTYDQIMVIYENTKTDDDPEYVLAKTLRFDKAHQYNETEHDEL